MTTPNNPVRHLLWCALVAIHSENQSKPFRSELARRQFVSRWLNSARCRSVFNDLADEFSTLRKLLEITDKSVRIDQLLNTLLVNSENADTCDLFRFRAVLNTVRRKRWRVGVCNWPEQIVPEILERRKGQHLLQLTPTKDAFAPTGEMIAPLTFQIIFNCGPNTEIEKLFYLEQFQVVIGKDSRLNRQTQIRTLHIGIHSLPEPAWGPTQGEVRGHIWKPDIH